MSADPTVVNAWNCLNEARVRARPGLRFRAESPENEWTCFLEDAETGRSYAMSRWQRWFVELIDDRMPAQDAARLVIACHPGAVSRETVVRFFSWLTGEGLLVDVPTVPVEEEIPSGQVKLAETKGWAGLRARDRIRYLGMNAVALGLIAFGIWLLRPALRISPDSAELAMPAPEAGGGPVFGEGRVVAVRAAASGILSEVMVSEGDAVAPGELVARIEDPEKLDRLGELKRVIGELRYRRDHYYRSGNQGGYLAASRQIASLSRRVGILEAEVTLAELRAPVSGVVETAELLGRKGNQVKSGELLLKVRPGEDADGELIAVLP